MADWIKEELKLSDNHTWRARPGCKIFVADRGAVRFDYPEDWVVIPGENSINFYDAQPPDDEIHLEVSLMRLPPVDLSGFGVREMVPAAIAGDARDIQSRGEVQERRNGDVEMAWIESEFIDHQLEPRRCYTRLCLARSGTIQAIITMEYWPEDADRARAAWDDVLGSLELGLYIEDPTRGLTLH